MKKERMFTHPRKILFIAIIAMSVAMASGCASTKKGGNSATASISTEEMQAPTISGFRDQSWGSDLDSVEASVITSNMQNGTDYNSGEESNYYMLSLSDAEVGGHKAAAAYVFQDNKLSFGVYQLTIDDSTYQDLLQKYTATYGEPKINAESSGWGPCAVWVDTDKNYVCISGFINSIVYVSSGSSYTDTLSNTLSEYHNVSLKDLLNQAGNNKGV